MFRNKRLVILMMAFQVFIIAGMIGKSMLPLVTGKEIKLRVVPVDPRDLFRGDYVELSYSYSLMDMDTVKTDIAPEDEFEFGDRLYLELEEVNGFYEPAGLWKELPGSHGTVMQAVVQSNWSDYNSMRIRCGIESYYTDPETAKHLEELTSRWDTTINVVVSVMVTDGGEARIKEIDYGE